MIQMISEYLTHDNPLSSRVADFFPIQLATPHQHYTRIAYDPVCSRSALPV